MPIDKKNMQSVENSLDETSLNILIGFFPKSKALTIKEIQKKSGYSYEPVYRTLSNLAERKLVTSIKIGKTLVYTLNTAHQYSKLAYYHYSSTRTMTFFRKYPVIKTALENLPKDKLDVAIIFGSYSRETQKESSDIDLIMVTHYEKEIESSIKHIKGMYSLDFQAIIMPREEFAKIKNENKELWDSLIKDGIIVKGSDMFYDQVYSHGK